MIRLFAFYFLLAFLIFSCSYSPDGENFNVIQPTLAFDQVINLNEIEEDTIYLRESLDFRYTTTGELIDESFSLVTLGVHEILESQKNTNYFSLNPESFQSGYHKLKIEIFTKADVGTLADAIDYSRYVSSQKKELIIVINNALPPSAEILEIDTINHQLRIKWEKYDDFTFNKYTISKYAKESPTFSTDRLVKNYIFEDPQITELIDSSFLTGVVYYQLSTSTSNGTKKGNKSDPFVLMDSAKMKVEKIDDFHYQYTWKKPILFNNFHKYLLRVPVLGTLEFNNLEDTTFTSDLEMPFGQELNAYVSIIPKNRQTYTYVIFGGVSFIIGERIPKFRRIFNKENQSGLYALNNGKLFTIDSNYIESSYLYSNSTYFYTSYKNRYGYYRSGSAVELKVVDFESFTESDKIYNLKILFNYPYFFNQNYVNFSVSDNNFLACKVNEFNCAVDLNTGDILYYEYYETPIKISQGGNYLVSNDSLFILSGNQYEYLREFKFAERHKTFFLIDELEKYVLIFKNSIDFYSLQDGSFSVSIPFTSEIESVVPIDRSQNKFGVFCSGYIFIVDLDKEEILHRIRGYRYEKSGDVIWYSLNNNRLTSSTGFLLDLNTIK